MLISLNSNNQINYNNIIFLDCCFNLDILQLNHLQLFEFPILILLPIFQLLRILLLSYLSINQPALLSRCMESKPILHESLFLWSIKFWKEQNSLSLTLKISSSSHFFQKPNFLSLLCMGNCFIHFHQSMHLEVLTGMLFY